MMETHHKKTFNYIINIYFKILKTLNEVDDEFKDWTLMFSNKLDVEIVYVFKVGTTIITIKFKFIRSNIFVFTFFIPIFWQVFFIYIFPWTFTIFPSFFPTRNSKFEKNENKINVNWEEGELIQLFKPKISPN